MTEIKYIISDLDGTLVNTFEANFAAYHEVLAEYGFELTRESYRASFGQRLDDLLATLDDGHLLSHLAEIKVRKAKCYPQFFNLLHLNEPLVGFYRMFVANGGHLALCSTASATNVLNVLQAVDCQNLFEFMITGENVKHGKPAPDCYLAGAERWQVAPQDILVFEDSDIGIQAALNAGSQVIKVGCR